MKATKTLRNMTMAVAAGVLALAGTMVSAGAAQADYSYGSELDEPGIIYQGGHLDAGDTRLILQTDGNLVLYKYYQTPNPLAVWAAPGSWGCGTKAIMQGDGNFVVYGDNNRVCYSSNTFKTNSFQSAGVVVADKGGLKVVFTDTRQWSAITYTIRSTDPY